MSRRRSDLLFALLVGLALLLSVVAGLVLSGHLVSDPGAADVAAPPPPPAAKPRPARTKAQPVAKTKPKRAAVEVASVRIDASRGDCWVVAHGGSATGPVLLQRVLRNGEQVTVHARRVWLELGAAGNVDVTVDGKPRQIPSGTTSLLLG